MPTNKIKRFSNSKIESLLCYIIGIFVCLYLLSQTKMFSIYFVASISSKFFFASTIFCIFYLLFFKKSSVDFLFILLIAFSTTVSYFVGSGITALDFIYLLVGYISLPVYILFFKECDLSCLNIKFFRRLFLFLSIVFVFLFLFSPNYSDTSGALTLGFSNSNLAGMILFFTITSLSLSFYRIKISKKILVIFLEIVLLYLTFITQCRTAFILSAVIVFVSLLKKPIRVGRFFVIFCIISPVIFMILYLFLYQNTNAFGIMLFDKILFSGRQELFEKGINFSIFGSINTASPFGLNLAYSLTNVLGLFGYVLFCIFYYKSSIDIFVKSNKCKKYFPLFCIGMVFLYGCTETAIFVNGSIYSALFLTILLLSKQFDR